MKETLEIVSIPGKFAVLSSLSLNLLVSHGPPSQQDIILAF